MPEEVIDRFIDAVEACSVAGEGAANDPLKVVYTPLNGTGLECVSRILDRKPKTEHFSNKFGAMTPD